MPQTPKEILDTMLGFLGFVCDIKEMRGEGGLTLQVYTADSDKLIGPRGETLDHLQSLLNRILQEQDPSAERVHVDVEHFRQIREYGMLQRVREIAALVRKTGRPYHLDPMNSYDRWIIHNAFKDDPEVMTVSPPDDGRGGRRMKRITIRRRPSAPPVQPSSGGTEPAAGPVAGGDAEASSALPGEP